MKKCILAVLCALASPHAKPNILFILTDDQTYEAVHATGDPQVITPNLDHLTEIGTAFSHAYNMGSFGATVCASSRTMFNTGRFLWRAQGANLATEQSQKRLWSQLMKKAGYATYMTGKWHVNDLDPANLFDVVVHKRPGMASLSSGGYYDFPPALSKVGYYFERPPEGTDEADLYAKPRWSPFDTTLGGQWQGGKHWAEVCADDAIGFLKAAAKDPAPFFMYIAFNSVHQPRQSPKAFLDMYPRDKFTIPSDFKPLYMAESALRKLDLWQDNNDEDQAPFPRTPFAVKTHRSEYYAMVTHMDAQVGRILAALDSSGKRDSTIIIFTSDNGISLGHHGLFGKQDPYDPAIRMPFIIAGARIPKQRIDARIYIQDAMATTLELAGIPKPAYIDFNSLLPLIKGDANSNHDAIYVNFDPLGKQKAIVAGEYKLIYYPPLDSAVLIDVKDDPTEEHNLIDSANHAAVIDTLWKSFLAMEKGQGKTTAYKYVPPPISGPQVGLGEWSGEATRIGKEAARFLNPTARYDHFEVYGLNGRWIGRWKATQGEAAWSGLLPSGAAAKPGVYFLKYGSLTRKQVVAAP